MGDTLVHSSQNHIIYLLNKAKTPSFDTLTSFLPPCQGEHLSQLFRFPSWQEHSKKKATESWGPQSEMVWVSAAPSENFFGSLAFCTASADQHLQDPQGICQGCACSSKDCWILVRCYRVRPLARCDGAHWGWVAIPTLPLHCAVCAQITFTTMHSPWWQLSFEGYVYSAAWGLSSCR